MKTKTGNIEEKGGFKLRNKKQRHEGSFGGLSRNAEKTRESITRSKLETLKDTRGHLETELVTDITCGRIGTTKIGSTRGRGHGDLDKPKMEILRSEERGSKNKYCKNGRMLI
jgi:hypothetical protein